jgi:hypothetical protein
MNDKLGLKAVLEQAEQGNKEAAATFAAELAPELSRILGRALRKDVRPTRLTQQLKARALAAASDWPIQPAPEQLVEEAAAGLARRAERRLLAGMTVGRPLRETVRDPA